MLNKLESWIVQLMLLRSFKKNPPVEAPVVKAKAVKKKTKKRALRHKLRNPIAMDLRTPKYKAKVKPNKKKNRVYND